MDRIEIKPASARCYHDLALMVGELLHEIMAAIGQSVFNYNERETEARAKELIESGKYWVWLARDEQQKPVGFISLYESFALYAEGAYGTIPELYVRKEHRSGGIGQKLLQSSAEFTATKGWHRLEVTTPPLPEFERTLQFYQNNGFAISGGRKLKADILP